MSEPHETPKNLDNKLKFGFFINTSFTIFQFFIGFLSGSLGLISDASHNLTDSLSLLIAFFGQKVAKREANNDHSYGYGRATIIAALLNGIILILLALYIFYEAFKRIAAPEPVEGSLVIIGAFMGILVNGSVALLFRKETSDLNMRGAYLSMFYDMLASVGVLIAGILIVLTKQTIFDPIISILIGIMLIKSSWGVVRSALHVLLEGVPEGLNVEEVRKTILNETKIKNIDDLHVWAISSRYAALSCHLIIEDCTMEESTKIVKDVKEELHQKFNIEHAAIETELVECTPDK